jgi:hypothetical protein
VYVWQSPNGKLALRSFSTDGTMTSFPADGPTGVSPDPTAKRVAQNGTKGLAVYDASGALVWQRELDASGGVVWLDDGSLLLLTGSGIVHFDATGKAVGSRCGWFFGKSTHVHPLAPPVAPVCAVARHW